MGTDSIFEQASSDIQRSRCLKFVVAPQNNSELFASWQGPAERSHSHLGTMYVLCNNAQVGDTCHSNIHINDPRLPSRTLTKASHCLPWLAILMPGVPQVTHRYLSFIGTNIHFSGSLTLSQLFLSLLIDTDHRRQEAPQELQLWSCADPVV